jgi:hypothetical protein
MLGLFVGPEGFDFILIIYLSSRGGQPISKFKWFKIKVLPETFSGSGLAECMEFFEFKELK